MRRYLLIIAALVGAIAGVVVLSLFRSPTLGLDLQGGLEVVLEARAPRGEEVTPEAMERAVGIIRERIDKLGVAEPDVRQQGENQISVALAGIHDPGRAAEVVGQTAQLEFYDLEANVVGPTKGELADPVVPTEELISLLTPANRLDEGAEPNSWYVFSKDKKLLAGPADTREEVLDDLEGGRPEGSRLYVVPGDRIVLTCGETNTRLCPGPGGGFVPQANTTYYYLFQYRPDDEDPVPEVTGKDLRAEGTRQDFDQGQPIVTLEFSDEGGRKFHEVTRELARRGRSVALQLGVPTGDRNARQAALQRFAIVLDNEIRSFPTIDFGENPDGIAGGRAQITGLDSSEEARDLALVLQTGALPLEFVQVERSDISATLGEDSLREALWAATGGIIAVVLFLLLVYRFLGLVAVFGLAVYGVLLYGTILAFGVTMTLPGFAGLILTLGVAADANIVIFERIKEEARAGKSVRAAIGAGYRKGFNTIVDANVVTMITAAVLFLVATGGVRGFALMLLLGTLMSMVTAVAATRAILGLLAGFRWFENPVFMGAKAGTIPSWQKVDFIGKRMVWAALSATVLAVGFGALVLNGLNLGIDFRGGSQISFQTPEPVPVEQVRQEAAALGGGDAVIQGRGELVNGGYREFQLRTRALDADQQTQLQESLQREVGATAIGVKNVSASFSRQILQGALIAILVSLALIVVYVTVRFEFKFAIPVLVALLHDVFVAVGVYSLTAREVTTATVAAILTILGYSVYDTIIIFDRVRENIGIMRRSSFDAISNQSLWEVLRRSIATTISTLLPVGALFFFGGETLKDFAFALMVGIGAGAYSSIFVAAPLLAILKGREPEYEKRKGAGLVEKREEPGLEPAPVIEREPERAPAAVAVAADGESDEGDGASAAARREARRKRRRARPHGRAR